MKLKECLKLKYKSTFVHFTVYYILFLYFGTDMMFAKREKKEEREGEDNKNQEK